MTRLKDPKTWFYGLLAAFIGGGASALTADQGLALAARLGVDVPVLNWKAIGIVALSAGLFNAAMYLKQSPLPPIEEEKP